MPRSVATAASLTAALGARASQLSTPALVIDREAAVHNISRMVQRVGDPRRWRPHIKTIKQAPLVAALFDAGITKLKCATPLEAELALATAQRLGVDLDLLAAYPLAAPGVDAILELARRVPHNARLSLLADSPSHLRELDAQCEGATLGVFLDVDLGMGRTGQPPSDWMAAASDIQALAHLELRGLHGYDGHHKGSRDDTVATAHSGYDRLLEMAATLSPDRPQELITSGTHSYMHALAHEGLRAAHESGRAEHSVSAGTIVLSDRRSGPAVDDLGLRQAAFVASRVISTGRGRVTLDCGSKGLAPDTPPESFEALDQPGLVGRRRSEEHLVCEQEAGRPLPARGELLWVVPEHVCTTVNMYREAIHLLADGSLETVAVSAASRLPWGLREGASA